MADEWQVGDLALCVDASRNPSSLKEGMIYLVSGIHPPSDCPFDNGAIGLFLAGVVIKSISGAANANRFRRIPPHTIDDEDRETIRLLTGEPVHLPDPEHETCDGLPDGDRSARPEFPLSHEDDNA